MVALYAHRLAGPNATGIARYVHQIIASIAERHVPTIDYVVGASPERSERAPASLPLPVMRPPSLRRPLHLAWGLSRWPAPDRFIGRPDLVHILYPSTPVPSRVKVIYTVHDLMPVLHRDWHGRPERWLFARALRHAADRAERLVANSSKTAAELTEHLGIPPERIVVVPLGVGDQFFQRIPPTNVEQACALYGVVRGEYAIVIGTVSTRKNLLPVLRAIAQLVPRQGAPKRPRLLVVGPPGVGADEVEQEVRRLRIDHLVRLTGWLPDEHLVPLLAGARFLLHPSVDEGFGMTPLEAMALEVPCLVSSAGSLPEVVGDAAMLVPPDDTDAWAAAITIAMENPEAMMDLTTKGQARAAGFTWRRTAEQTIAVHEECLNS